jgi:nitroreductase
MKECLRSITFFDPTRKVPDELTSGYNLQPWEVVVVKDKEKKRQLKDICYGQQKVEDAS